VGGTRKLILEITGFSEGDLPFRHLEVPITAGKLSKMECTVLVEKIAVKIKYWSTRSLSYANRLALVNTVVIGVYKFWASIFMLPKEVTQDITRLCRDYI